MVILTSTKVSCKSPPDSEHNTKHFASDLEETYLFYKFK